MNALSLIFLLIKCKMIIAQMITLLTGCHFEILKNYVFIMLPKIYHVIRLI